GRPLRVNVSARAVNASYEATRAQGSPDGSFALELDPGSYLLTAAAEGYRSESAPCTVGDADVDDVHFALGPSLRVSGRVEDSTGHGVGRVSVTALPDGAPGRGTRGGVNGTTNEDGGFA